MFQGSGGERNAAEHFTVARRQDEPSRYQASVTNRRRINDTSVKRSIGHIMSNLMETSAVS